MLHEIRPADVIAVLTITGCFVLIGTGHNDAIVMSVLLTVVGFYFGRVSARGEQIRQGNGNGASPPGAPKAP